MVRLIAFSNCTPRFKAFAVTPPPQALGYLRTPIKQCDFRSALVKVTPPQKSRLAQRPQSSGQIFVS